MKNQGIILLGLGPGNPEMLTRQAWEILSQSDEVYLRTRQHPVVNSFPPGLEIHSFDQVYETSEDFAEVYNHIVARVLELGRRPRGVVYAVPGHPFVAEATGPEIARRAREANIPVQVVDGLSFLEPTLTALGQDIFPQTVMVDALELASRHVPSFSPNMPAIIAQIYSREIAGEVKITLMAHYPDDHGVKFVHAAGAPQQIVESLALYQIDRSEYIDLLSALYVPPLEKSASFDEFQEIIARLRAPDGCPWDRKQTHKSLRSHLLEEAYEVIAAVDRDDPDAVREELGDLLLLIVMNAQIASETGEFKMAEVLDGIYKKIVYRHPHVFGDLELDGVDSVLVNWEKLKAEERAANGNAESSLLDGVALALPALVQAVEYQGRAARVGFDWPGIEGVYAKLMEEIGEVRAAKDAATRTAEIGDLFFAAVNLARWLEVDAESALREANERFRQRFSQIELAARNRGCSVEDLTLEEMEAIWQSAKR